MQSDATQKLDAGMRAALAGWGDRPGRDPRQEARDTGRVPRLVVVRGLDDMSGWVAYVAPVAAGRLPYSGRQAGSLAVSIPGTRESPVPSACTM